MRQLCSPAIVLGAGPIPRASRQAVEFLFAESLARRPTGAALIHHRQLSTSQNPSATTKLVANTSRPASDSKHLPSSASVWVSSGSPGGSRWRLETKKSCPITRPIGQVLFVRLLVIVFRRASSLDLIPGQAQFERSSVFKRSWANFEICASLECAIVLANSSELSLVSLFVFSRSLPIGCREKESNLVCA